MASDNVIRNVLSWVVDTASANKAVSEINKVGNITTAQAARSADAFTEARRITAQYDDVLGQLGPTASSSLRVLETSMRAGADETERLKRTTAEAAEEYDRLGTSAARAAQQSGRSGGSRLDSIDRAASVGSQVLGGLGAGEAANTAALVADLAGGFASLNPLMLATTAAGGALALVLQQTAAASAAAKAAEENRLNAEADISRFIATSTREQKETRLRELEDQYAQERYIQDRRVADLRDVQDQLTPAAGFLNSVFSPDLVGRAQALEAAIATGTTTLSTNIVAQADLKRAIEFGTDTAADMAVAEQQLADERQRILDANAQLERQRTQQELEDFRLLLDADNMTVEQRHARIDQMRREQDAIRAQLATGELSQGAADELRLRFADLTGQIEILKGVIQSTADTTAMAAQKQKALEEATKAAADALTERNDQYLDAVDREVSAREKATELEGKINETVAERIRDIEALQAQSTAKVGEIEAKTARDREKVVQDSQDRITKLLRDTGREQKDAVGRRDTDAYRLTTRQAKDALDDQQLADKRRLESITETAQDAVTTEQAAARARISTIEQGADRTISVLQAQVNTQYDLARQASVSQAFLAASTAGSVINAQTKMYSDMNTLAYNNAYSVAQSFQNGWNAGLGGAYGGASSFPTLSSTYGAYQPMTTARVEEIATKQYLKIKMAARGGRMIIP